MYNTEQLKETYKRTNETEQSVMCLIIDAYPDLTIIRGKNIISVDWCTKQMKGKNVLILDVKNSNVTHTGRNRIIEFCFIHCMGKITWIDAKQAKTTTNVTDLHGECYRAKNLKGNVLFVVDGKGYPKEVIDVHTNFIKELQIDNNVDVITLTQIRKLTQNFFN